MQAISRRSLLGGLALIGVPSGVWDRAEASTGQRSEEKRSVGQDVQTTFEFGGEVQGWQGRSPEEIEGETNPALDLDLETEYRVVWENLDGVDHDFTIVDADGNELVGTETMAEQGETRSLTFTATAEMDRYICTIHPNRMVGRIQTGEDEGVETPTPADEDIATHYRLNAVANGWEGQSPGDIEGETNPTLELEPGQQYRVTWENADGIMHNFTLLDAEGNSIQSTETTSVEGETASLTFTAIRGMAQYYCGIHTVNMRGDIQIIDETPVSDSITDVGEVDVRYELGAVIGGWQGRLPEEEDHDRRIDGEQNPTLEFDAGNRYLVVWENADGVPHNFTIQDGDGNDIMATETTANRGAKHALTFTATPEMSAYVCTIHPETMKGDIAVSGGGIGDRLAGPEGLVWGVAALTAAFVGGLGYTLSKYFGNSAEP